jgi:hypothetical protein
MRRLTATLVVLAVGGVGPAVASAAPGHSTRDPGTCHPAKDCSPPPPPSPGPCASTVAGSLAAATWPGGFPTAGPVTVNGTTILPSYPPPAGTPLTEGILSDPGTPSGPISGPVYGTSSSTDGVGGQAGCLVSSVNPITEQVTVGINGQTYPVTVAPGRL